MTKLPSICIVGAGLCGLCTAIQLKRKLGLESFEIFDSNKDLGGTWLVNTYPGSECDVPIHSYNFSFDPRSEWKGRYAKQPEIQEYLQFLGKKYELYSHIHFNHFVQSLVWMENTGQWKVTVKDLVSGKERELIFDIVICGTGLLRYPNIPEIFEDFKGPKMHSAEWDPSVSLEGKRVGIIGSGTSALQILPSIVDKPGIKLISYQRTAPWVFPRFAYKHPNWIKWAFAHLPGLRKLYRWKEFISLEMHYPIFRTDTISSHLSRPLTKLLCKAYLRMKVSDPKLRNLLKPGNNILGCKRPGVNSKFYPALCKPNVEVRRDKIIKVTSNSIILDDGTEDILDVLILATGFKVQEYFGPMEIIGRNGEIILEKWKSDRPNHYKAMTSSDLPNYFNLLGPGADVGHNSLVFLLECQVRWMIKMISELIERKERIFCVKQEAETAYMKKLDERLKGTIWTRSGCNSIYSNQRGVLTIKHYDSLVTHWWKLRHPKFSVFDFYS